MRYTAARKLEILRQIDDATSQDARLAIMNEHGLSLNELLVWRTGYACKGQPGLRCNAAPWKTGYVRKKAA